MWILDLLLWLGTDAAHPGIDSNLFLGAGLLSVFVSAPIALSPPGAPWAGVLLCSTFGLGLIGALASLFAPLAASLTRLAAIAAINIIACSLSVLGFARL